MADKAESTIVRLGKLADQPAELTALGKRIVTQAVKSAVEEKLQLKTSSPMVVRRVNAGDVVPADLRGEAGVVLSRANVAASGWDKSWLNLVIWDKSWAEDQDEAARPEMTLSDPAEVARLKTVLTPDELVVVQKLKITS
jgi:hypothetical protein